jgi:hypothetical protein
LGFKAENSDKATLGIQRQKNLKLLKNKQLGFLTGVAKNRSCSVDGKNFTSFQNLKIPEDG